MLVIHPEECIDCGALDHGWLAVFRAITAHLAPGWISGDRDAGIHQSQGAEHSTSPT